MKKRQMSQVLVFAAVATFAGMVSGCTKSVSKDGKSFGQIDEPQDPNPVPTQTATPSPAPTLSPVPSPTPTPFPTVTPSPMPSPSPAPVACDPSRIGAANGFSIYAKADAKVTGTTLRKRVAGADAFLETTKVGMELSADKTRPDLISSHDLSVDGVKAPNGKAIYGRSLDSRGSSAYGGFAKVSGIDLDTDWKKILDFSKGCMGVKQNATVQKVCVPASKVALMGELTATVDSDDEVFGVLEVLPEEDSPKPEVCTLKIKGTDPKLNLANISIAQITGVSAITVDIPADAYFVGNLPALKSATFKGVEVRMTRGIAVDRLYWNLPMGEKFSFDRTKFLGTVLSPRAKVRISKNDGLGAFWAEDVAVFSSSW